jgi:hypothetical protein
VAYRLSHLSDTRLIEVLKAVARKAGWDRSRAVRK